MMNKKLILRGTIMDHDFIIKKLLKEIEESQEKADRLDGFHNSMYHRGRIEGLKSAIRWVEADKWANEIFKD
nr:MAG TPA: hypothetical protein [Caudoviricetes sp.]